MLRKVQEDFRATVLGAEDVAATHLFAARGPVARRIAVHRNTVQASLTDVLATAFPVVKRIIGEEFFAGFARRFIATQPPRVPQLSEYGRDFPAFIAVAEQLKSLPYLYDVARLEWARGEAYFAADAEPLPVERLGSMPAEALPEAHLVLHPATRLVASQYPIHRIWTVNQADVVDVPQVDMTVAEAALVLRSGFHVVTRKVTLGDGAFIAALEAGETLSNAADAALAADPVFELQTALAAHLTGGTFCDIIPPRS